MQLNAACAAGLEEQASPARSANADAFRDTRELEAFGAFAQACDAVRTAKAAARLLISAAQRLGFERILLTTHVDPKELGSVGVLAHNWDERAVCRLYACARDARNPLFEQTERTPDLVYWNQPSFRTQLDPRQLAWMEELSAFGLRDGVSQRVRSSLVPASCSLTPATGEPASVRWIMRAAAYVFHHIVALQRPRLAESDLLTLREHQCLALATFSGLRPREVAETLGVSVNTVRSMRQSACARLGARSQEEAVWRMVESGQLIPRGRASRPRSW
jgi:DNA-binding CsgD family transcriptional regulator